MSISDPSFRLKTDLVWQRLIAIMEDQAQILIRTAFSATTREAGDLSAGVFDAKGRMIAQAITGTPGHVNSMALAVQHFNNAFPLWDLTPGDVLISNDPWLCSGHRHDFTVVTPVFHQGAAVGSVANTIHVVDIGGLGFGPDGRDVYEEGLGIPICKIVDAGRLNETLIAVIQASVREADQVIGDINSAIVANQTAANQISTLMKEFRLRDLTDVAEAVIARTRVAVEQRLSALPSGCWSNALVMDGYAEPITLKVVVKIANGRMKLDFDGTSPQSDRGINVVLNYTKAYASFGVNCIVNPDIPCNHGSLEPIEVVAPPGCILNAQHPAPVAARHMIGHMLPDLIFGALSGILPVPAEGAGLIWNPSLRGLDRHGRAFATVTFNAGGAGAHADRDGWNATAFPSGVRTMPVEAIEATVPVLFRRKELRPDSGGAGRQRGGLGQVIEIAPDTATSLIVNAMFDRTSIGAKGAHGGQDGSTGAVALRSGREFRPKGLQKVEPGDSLVLELPGGGGYGLPSERELSSIRHDIAEGYVSSEVALKQYPQLKFRSVENGDPYAQAEETSGTTGAAH